MQETTFYHQINHLAEHYKEEAHALLFQREPLEGDTIKKQWADLLGRIEHWRRQYFAKSDAFTLYGYMTWYLQVSFCELHQLKTEDISQALLKIMLSESFKDTPNLFFNEETTIAYLLDANCFDLMEYHRGYLLSPQEFFQDLAHFHDVSFARYQHWKKKYSNNQKVRDMLEIGYAK